jgi:hypothetical protein
LSLYSARKQIPAINTGQTPDCRMFQITPLLKITLPVQQISSIRQSNNIIIIMRTIPVIFSIIGFFSLVYTLWAIGPLLTLLIEDGLADAIHYNEIRMANYASGKTQHIIPRIIYQTYKDEKIPKIWEVPRNVAWICTLIINIL